MTRYSSSAVSVAVFVMLLPSYVQADSASVGLLDPTTQPKFATMVPNPLDPSFLYDTVTSQDLQIAVGQGQVMTGLVHPTTGQALSTTVWGYGNSNDDAYTWPGKTFQVRKDQTIRVPLTMGIS